MTIIRICTKLDNLFQQLESAKQRLERLDAKASEARKQSNQARDQVRDLRDAIHAQEIKELINVDGAVCYGTVGEFPKLDNLCGTVIKLGRRYAVVRFENGENWKVPFSNLCKTEDKAKRPRLYGVLKL